MQELGVSILNELMSDYVSELMGATAEYPHGRDLINKLTVNYLINLRKVIVMFIKANAGSIQFT
jgi:hypothetical protein